MKTLLFLYNPKAGRGSAVRHLEEIIRRFTVAGYLVTVRPTQGSGDARRIAAQMAADFDRVVCCGGDGTLNETAAGLLTLPEPRPPLGYLPAGTTNDFCRTLGLPVDLAAAADIAAQGVPLPCDVGTFNDRPFLYVAGFGVFTAVSYAVPQRVKNVLGRPAYVLAGVGSLFRMKPCRVRVCHDGVVLEDDWIYAMVSNSVRVGGFRWLKPETIAPDDGVFEVLLVKRPRSAGELRSILHSLRTKTPRGSVISFQTDDVRFESETPLAWTLDGEYGGDAAEACIRVTPGALRIVRKDGE